MKNALENLKTQMKIWIARNSDGRLLVHLHKPRKDENGNWFNPYISYTEIPSVFFAWATTDEPIELIPEEEADYMCNGDSIWISCDDDMDMLNVYLEDPDLNRDLSGITHSQCYPFMFCITNEDEYRLYEYIAKSSIVRFIPREPEEKGNPNNL